MTRTTLSQRSVTVATYPTYDGAKDALEYLKDHDFPTQYAAIIAERIRRVKGRSTALLVAMRLLNGIIGGALIGAAICFVLEYFQYIQTAETMETLILYGAILGAGLGLILAAIGALLFGTGKSAHPRYTAEVFDVAVHEQYMDQARRLLSKDEPELDRVTTFPQGRRVEPELAANSGG